MQLADALIATSGSDPLPGTEWVGGLLTAYASGGRLGSSTDNGPRRCAVVANAGSSLCRGSSAWEWHITL